MRAQLGMIVGSRCRRTTQPERCVAEAFGQRHRHSACIGFDQTRFIHDDAPEIDRVQFIEPVVIADVQTIPDAGCILNNPAIVFQRQPFRLILPGDGEWRQDQGWLARRHLCLPREFQTASRFPKAGIVRANAFGKIIFMPRNMKIVIPIRAEIFYTDHSIPKKDFCRWAAHAY